MKLYSEGCNGAQMKKLCPSCHATIRRKPKEIFRCFGDKYKKRNPIASFQCSQCNTRIQPAKGCYRLTWIGYFIMMYSALAVFIVDTFFRRFGKAHFTGLLWMTWPSFGLGVVAMFLGIGLLKYEIMPKDSYRGPTNFGRMVIILLTLLFTSFAFIVIYATIFDND